MPLARLTLLAAALALAGCGSGGGDRTTAQAASTASPAAAPKQAQAPKGDSTLNRIADHARVEGSANAALWVVEVSDFQCPFCREWHEQSYQAIKAEYVDSGKIRFAYINMPLSIHRNAWPAAEAAMCAAAQNKFWPMHDSLFATQSHWENDADPHPYLDSLAAEVGVEHGAYSTCMSQHLMRPLIQADMDRATESGVNSTPTFLIGTQKIRGAQPLDQLRAVIDGQLAKAGAQ